jgi:hypothetical protein
MSLSLRQRRANIHGNQFGGNKKQGLAPNATHYFMANATGQEYYTESGDGRQRFTLVCVNQLGGVSKGRSQFRNNADGNRGNRCGIPPFAGYVYEFTDPMGNRWQYAFNHDGTGYDLNLILSTGAFSTPVPDIEIAQSIDDSYLYFSPMIFPENSNIIVRYVQTGMRFSRDYGSINIDYFDNGPGGPFFQFNKDTVEGYDAFTKLSNYYRDTSSSLATQADVSSIKQTMIDNVDSSYIVIPPLKYPTNIPSTQSVLSYNLPPKGGSSVPQFAGRTYILADISLGYKFHQNGKYYNLIDTSSSEIFVKNIEIAQSRIHPYKYFSPMIFSSSGPYPKYVQTGMIFNENYTDISVNNYNLTDGGPFFTISPSDTTVFDSLYDSNNDLMKNNWQNGYLLAATSTLAEKPFTLKQ